MADFTIKDFEEFLAKNAETDEVKAVVRKLATPEIDRRITDALKTYKENHFDKEVAEKVNQRVKELHPDETPEMKRIRELEDKDIKRDAELAKERLDRQVMELASKKGIKTSLVSKIKFNDAAEAESFINEFLAEKAEIEKSISNEMLKKTTGAPTSAGSTGTVDIKNMSVNQLIALENEGKLDSALNVAT